MGWQSEFAFLDFRDSPEGRQAYIQASTLAVWEVILLFRSYDGNVAAVAKHLRWPEAKVRAAVNYAEAFREEIDEATAENDHKSGEIIFTTTTGETYYLKLTRVDDTQL